MLEKPDLNEASIISCLQAEYGLAAPKVTFLPLGADVNTAVYRVCADHETPYFLKLRSGAFDETSVTLPKFLNEQGLAEIIPPLASQSGQLWASLGAFKVILYPFVDGRDGYEASLTDQHWCQLGRILGKLHTLSVPPVLLAHVRRETFSPQWRDSVRTFLQRVQTDVWDEPVAVETARVLNARRGEILDLVERAERLAQALQAQATEFVLCHSDLHAGNILIDANGGLHIVDWDSPILAPKERDLMYVGGGQMAGRRTPQQEEALFYPGYGPKQINQHALAYYRYERIVEDVAAFSEQLLLTTKGAEDRKQSFRYLASNFQPNNVIEIAYAADKTSRTWMNSGATAP